MIADRIENASLYEQLSESIARGLEIIRDPLLAEKPDGRYEVAGDDLFMIVQRYPTKDKNEVLFEAHRAYIDIQVILDGQETIGYAPIDGLEEVKPYAPDMIQFKDPSDFTELRLARGNFAIFFPGDAHKPCCHFRGKSNVHKVVVKVRV